MSQLVGMLQSSGPLNWEVARQVASQLALAGSTTTAVDQPDNDQLAELVSAAQTLVVAETGLVACFRAPFHTMTRLDWVELQITALAPVLETMATALGNTLGDLDIEMTAELGDGPAIPGLPNFEMFSGMLSMVAPVLLGVQAGSLIGSLAQHTLGRYDLPLPGADEPSLCFVVGNIDEFEASWELDRADLRFYIALHEVVHVAQRSVPWVTRRLNELTTQYVAGYSLTTDDLETKLASKLEMINPDDPESMRAFAQHPEEILAALQTPYQVEIMAQLQLFNATLEGFANAILERVGQRLIPTFSRIHEAMKRHRVVRGGAERFAETLLGLRMDGVHYERGDSFAAGVVERTGTEGLQHLWKSEDRLPTPAEFDAPGLWLARIELIG